MANKAIVIFYMGGGHDSYNMFVPLDRYAAYANYRGPIAQPQSNLVNLGLGANNLAMHKSMSRMRAMISSGMAAPILGTGNLVQPTTNKNMDSVQLPPFIGSHSHQHNYVLGGNKAVTGWGGRMLDAWYAGKSQAWKLSPSITTGLDRTLVSSDTIGQAMVRDEGSNWPAVSAQETVAMANLYGQADYRHVMEKAAKDIFTGAIAGQEFLKSLFAQYQSSATLDAAANVAAKLIAAAPQLGHERQIIQIQVPGGWDTHHGTASSTDASSIYYLGGDNTPYVNLDNYLADFMDLITSYGVADNVVCITASEFGRSLRTNGNGTDHGWGSNQLVFGKPVRGNNVYGSFVDYEDPDYISSGMQIIPKFSDAQSYATLGKWFGLSDVQLLNIFPELKNFTQKDLGFL